MRSIRGELEQKNSQLEQYNQLLQQQVEGSRQHATQLERRIDGLNQQCRLKDEANLQNTELYQKLEATDKMISVFQVHTCMDICLFMNVNIFRYPSS